MWSWKQKKEDCPNCFNNLIFVFQSILSFFCLKIFSKTSKMNSKSSSNNDTDNHLESNTSSNSLPTILIEKS